MAFLQEIIILIAGCSIILAKPTYDYEYEPYRSYHVPWAIKYPQPLISIDGAWPISYSYPLPRDTDYQYEETNYQQEILTKSLNQALTKLNQLLPPSSSNQQETTPFPPSTKPEVLVEALNKAIDRLGVLLTRQPLPVPVNKPETSTQATAENIQPTMAPAKVYDSVSSAINDLDKLFATLPDELKAIPSQIPQINNAVKKPIVLEFQPMRPTPFVSEPLKPTPFVSEPLKPNMENTKESTTEGPLFTSQHFVEQENIVTTTEKVKEINNKIALTIPTPTRNSDENNIFTIAPIVETSSISTPSSVEPTENVVDTTIAPTEIIDVESTVLPTENNVEVETTIRNDVLSSIGSILVPRIDIRFSEEGRKGRSDFVFPDQFDQMVSQNKKPAVQQELDLGTRFGEQGSTGNFSPVVQTSTPLTLEYKPSRPPFHPDIFPPNPSPRPQLISNLQTSTNFELGDRNKLTTVFQEQTPTQTQRPIQNPQIVLDYKPSRPPYHPDVYPPHPTPRPQTDSNLQTIVNNQQQSTQTQRPINNNQNTPIVLGYKPSRPPYHPDVYPPHPTARPQTDSNLQTETNFVLGDRNQQQSTQTQRPINNNQNTPIVLDYKPSRPFYHPDAYPPHPTARPQTDSNPQMSTNFELGDRNQPAIVNNQQQLTQTQRPIDNNQNTPIILEYKPSRPPFHPDVFPPHPTARPQTDSNQPGIVNNQQQPTQTQRPVENLADRFNVPDTTSTTTEIFFTTTHNNEPYHPTHYYSTPISLEYKPTRPFYAPHPVVYPKPIIPPGTPWPASSTERPKN